MSLMQKLTATTNFCLENNSSVMKQNTITNRSLNQCTFYTLVLCRCIQTIWNGEIQICRRVHKYANNVLICFVDFSLKGLTTMLVYN